MKHISYIIKFQISPYIKKIQIPRDFNIDLRKLRCYNIKQSKYCQIPNVRGIYYRIFKLISAISKKIYIVFHWKQNMIFMFFLLIKLTQMIQHMIIEGSLFKITIYLTQDSKIFIYFRQATTSENFRRNYGVNN